MLVVSESSTSASLTDFLLQMLHSLFKSFLNASWNDRKFPAYMKMFTAVFA